MERRGRDFVNSTCSLFSSAATWRLTYSEPVVGVEAQHVEREQAQQRFQHRNHEPLRDGRHGADVLVLRHLVHDVDDVHALAPVPVAQMDGVHPQEARPAVRLGRLADPDRHRARPRLRPSRPPRPVGARRAQVVEVRARHVRQALEARVAMHVARAAQDLAGRQPRHPPERLVHLRQQPDVRRRVDRLERTTAVPRPPIHHGSGLRLLPDQPADLRRREAARLADVRPHAAPVGAAQPVVVERRQRPPHEGVRGPAILRLVVHGLRSLDEGPNLLHGAQALRLKCHDHPPSVEDSAPAHAHIALDSALRLMLT